MSIVVRSHPTGLTAEQYDESTHVCFGSDMPVLTEMGIEFSAEPEVFEVHDIDRR
jgi:hypothetical protein